LELPFTAQKLINRIKSFQPDVPKYILNAGPIQLNLQTNYITCYGHEAHATPRVVALLRNLIENKGKILDREILFKKVWATDYLGDTRSLDVHISWLRKVIEDDHRHPTLLLTIRGVGYKLDL
jgi:DNA-binding response OmpR family regulator